MPVDSFDLVSYLVLKTSYMTSEQFKARKSLEAYNQFVSGWIKDVSTMCKGVAARLRRDTSI